MNKRARGEEYVSHLASEHLKRKLVYEEEEDKHDEGKELKQFSYLPKLQAINSQTVT